MKKIVIGIDVGISTTKIVGIDEDGIVVSYAFGGSNPSPPTSFDLRK